MRGAPDRRRLAVAWYRIEFRRRDEAGLGDAEEEPASSPAGPRVREDGALFLPWDTELRWILPVDPRTGLRLGPPSLRGRGRLELETRTDRGTGERVRLDPDEIDGPREVPLPVAGEEPELVEIALRAIGRTTGPSAGVVLPGLELVSPKAEGIPEPRVSDVPGPPPRLIVLWVLDTLRADALEIADSPAVRELADEGVVFETALAQSSWTRAAMGTVLTGLSPVEHGAYRRELALDASRTTLAEMLSRSGWTTGAVVTNPNLTPVFGFSQGFDHFEVLPESARAAEVVERGLRWLDESDASRPRLLWLHPLEPHAPYDPPEEDRRTHAPGVDPEEARRSLGTLDDLQAGRRPASPELVEDLRSLYRAEVESADRAFARLVEELRRRGLWEDALVVFLSDHGEEMGEHGNWQHGKALFGESVRIPFLLKPPADWEGLPDRVPDPVQHADVLPTLLELAGLPVPDGLPGRSLVSLLQGRSLPPRPIFLHLHLDGPERRAVRLGRWKLVQELDGARVVRESLYDLESDPGEVRDLAADLPIRRRYLAGLLRGTSALPAGEPGRAVAIDPELERSLRALGYAG